MILHSSPRNLMCLVNAQLIPGWCENHKENECSTDDHIDNEVDDQDKESNSRSRRISGEFLVVGKHVAPSHVAHGWRIAVVASENCTN